MKTLFAAVLVLLFSSSSMADDPGILIIQKNNWQLTTVINEMDDEVASNFLSIVVKVIVKNTVQRDYYSIGLYCGLMGGVTIYMPSLIKKPTVNHVKRPAQLRFDKEKYFDLSVHNDENSKHLRLAFVKNFTNTLIEKQHLLVRYPTINNTGFIKVYIDLKKAHSGLVLFEKKCGEMETFRTILKRNSSK